MVSNRAAGEWTQMTFEEMAEQVSERVYDAAAAGISIYIGLEHLSADDLRIRSHKRADEVTYGTHGKLRLRPGQIVFGRRSANLRKLGVCQVDAVASEHAMILNERPSLAPGFLPFFMQSDIFMDRADEISEGSLSKTIKWATMAKQTFWVPPLEQQNELVELMQVFATAIEAGEEVVEAAQKIKRVKLTSLLEASDDADRQEVRFSDIATVEIGRQRSPAQAQGIRPIKYVRAVNIQDGRLDLDDLFEMDFSEKEQEFYQLRPDDILIVEGGSIGNYAMFHGFDEPLCFQKTVLRLRAKTDMGISPRFLLHLVAANYEMGRFDASAHGSTIKHLRIDGVALLKVSLPIDVKARERMVSELDQLSIVLHETRKHVEHIKSLRTSILNSILTPATSTPALVTA